MNQPETTAVTEARAALSPWSIAITPEQVAEHNRRLDAFEAAVRAEERAAGFDRTAEHSQHFGAPSEPSEQDVERAAEAFVLALYPGDEFVVQRRVAALTHRDAMRAALQAVRR